MHRTSDYGDKLYHPEPKRFHHLNRMALHAAYLAFQHPLKGTDVVIQSQVPFKIYIIKRINLMQLGTEYIPKPAIKVGYFDVE